MFTSNITAPNAAFSPNLVRLFATMMLFVDVFSDASSLAGASMRVSRATLPRC